MSVETTAAPRPLHRTARRVALWMTVERRATHGLAALRIVLGAGLATFLGVNFTARDYLWGPASRWAAPLDDHHGFGGVFDLFSAQHSLGHLTAWYVVTFVAAVALTLGWRTRVVTPVVLVLSTSLLTSQPFGWDQGDNVLRLLLLYLCCADSGARWSLDARRRTTAPRGALGELATVLHNAAVVAVAAQICVIYLTSGFAKAQGSLWQHGTGVYYPLTLDLYRPWPALSDALTSNALLVTVVSTGAIYVQALFPVALLHPVARRVGVVSVLGMHAGIAVVMGLPFFSLFMMAGDLVFVRERTFESVQAWVVARAESFRAARAGRASPSCAPSGPGGRGTASRPGGRSRAAGTAP